MIQGLDASVGIPTSRRDLPGLAGWQGLPGLQGVRDKGKIPEEFLTIFYRELLKQSFNPFENEEGTFTKTFSSGLLVEQLALELAKNKSFSLGNLFPNVQTEKVR